MTDNTIRVRADITDDPDAIHTDDGGQDDQNVVVPPPPAAGAAHLRLQARPDKLRWLLKWSKAKSQNTSDRKAKTILRRSCSSEKSRIWPAPTVGLTPQPTQTWLTI